MTALAYFDRVRYYTAAAEMCKLHSHWNSIYYNFFYSGYNDFVGTLYGLVIINITHSRGRANLSRFEFSRGSVVWCTFEGRADEYSPYERNALSKFTVFFH